MKRLQPPSGLHPHLSFLLRRHQKHTASLFSLAQESEQETLSRLLTGSAGPQAQRWESLQLAWLSGPGILFITSATRLTHSTSEYERTEWDGMNGPSIHEIHLESNCSTIARAVFQVNKTPPPRWMRMKCTTHSTPEAKCWGQRYSTRPTHRT